MSPELCGVTITFGIDQSGLSGGSGSTSKTSRPAPPSWPLCERRDERGFVHERAATDVHEPGAACQQREAPRVEQMPASRR